MELRHWGVRLAAVGLAVITAGPAAAQALTFSGSPAALHITTGVAGSPPTPTVDAATTYTTKTKQNQPKKITAQLDSDMPVGLSLTINMAAVTGATSAGTLTLTSIAQSAVNNITNKNLLTAAITYTFSATSAAGVIPSSTRTVTFTLLAFP